MSEPKVRRERDGRAARGAAPKPPWQVLTRADGSSYYRKQVVDPTTGRRRSVVGDTPEELLRRVSRITEARRDLKAAVVTVEDAAARVAEAQRRARGYALRDAWAAHERSASVSEAWRGKLRGFWRVHLEKHDLGRCMVHELGPQRVQGWLDGLRSLGSRGRQNAWTILAAVVRRAVESGHAGAMPWPPRWRPAIQLELKRERGALATREDEERFMAAARQLSRERAARYGTPDDLHIRALVMVRLGLRRGEALALTWGDIRRTEGGDLVVTIGRQGAEGWRKRGAAPNDPTKTREVRRVRIAQDGAVAGALREALRLAQERGAAEHSSPVFPNRRGQHEARDVIAPQLMRAIVKRAGLERSGQWWVQHSTRHSAVTRELVEGSPIRDIQALTGHKDVQTLMGYAHRVGVGLPTSRADRQLEAGQSGGFEALPSLADEQRLAANSAREKYLGRGIRQLAEYLPPRGEDVSREPPKPVKEEAQRAYMRAYMRAKRAGMGPDDCRTAARRAHRGVKGAWGRIAAEEQRRRQGSRWSEVSGESEAEAEHERAGDP